MQLRPIRHRFAVSLIAACSWLGSAQAAIVNYDFTVDAAGALATDPGNPFTGSFSFDGSLPFPTDLSSFSFSFVDSAGAAASYGLLDADTRPTAESGLLASGAFTGISYQVGSGDPDFAFTFSAGFGTLNPGAVGPVFNYRFQGTDYTGSLLEITEAAVPAPATPALLLIGAVWLMGWRRFAAGR
ncbi:hypothetical protein CKO31_21310 [Thiohalocapsa halophila]|uniref:PEP-CTERM sorting domain-containing protein n=1 Tax=Thiohalocapsa halophila TaxID=69359 RepID=A0ABS1CMT5_9GAMM|nr:PEP-CTERM sorting domain-containing protein [Thiohalocapsa halophila]MBK1633244.1 hypothetical protein [Thiohalocapsa halophila]